MQRCNDGPATGTDQRRVWEHGAAVELIRERVRGEGNGNYTGAV